MLLEGNTNWIYKKLGSGSGGVLARRQLNGRITLPTTIARDVGTP